MARTSPRSRTAAVLGALALALALAPLHAPAQSQKLGPQRAAVERGRGHIVPLERLLQSLALPADNDRGHRWPLIATGDNPQIVPNALKESTHDR